MQVQDRQADRQLFNVVVCLLYSVRYYVLPTCSTSFFLTFVATNFLFIILLPLPPPPPPRDNGASHILHRLKDNGKTKFVCYVRFY